MFKCVLIFSSFVLFSFIKKNDPSVCFCHLSYELIVDIYIDRDTHTHAHTDVEKTKSTYNDSSSCALVTMIWSMYVLTLQRLLDLAQAELAAQKQKGLTPIKKVR